jgi:hypothetical protein
MTILQQLIDIVSCRKDITRGEMYFIISSVLMYFKSPLKTQEWNTFHLKVKNGDIPLQEAIFMTDEEKNPELWKKVNKKTKSQLDEYLTTCLLNTRKYLLKKHPDLKLNSRSVKKDELEDIVLYVPGATPTFFPKNYVKDLLKNKIYINELTGQPFPKEVIEQIQKNKTIDCRKASKKCIDNDTFKKLMTRDLNQLQKLTSCCIKCKNKDSKFKSIKHYQTIYFCSLKCMNEWDFEK